MHNPGNYPIDAFPVKLREAIIALQEDTGFPVEMIGSTLLAATSLALQPLVEVTSPYSHNNTEPCSLYFLILAQSGEGKGPLFNKIMSPFKTFEEEMQQEYKILLDAYQKDRDTWNVKKKALTNNLMKALKKNDDSEEEELLYREHLDNEPVSPVLPDMFYDDNTPVGLIEKLNEYPNAGCFSSEAMTFFTGYLKNNQALLNRLWSNESYYYSRKEKSIQLNGCRLSVLLMTQPSEFERYVQKQGARDILNGLMARFLITRTISTKAQREVTLSQDRSDNALQAVHETFNQFLQKQKSMLYDKSIEPKILSLSDEAKTLFKSRRQQYNTLTAQGQKWEHIAEFVSKAESQVIRIAAMFDYFSPDTISAAQLSNAFTIVEWHLSQAAAYFYQSSEQFQLRQDVYDLFESIKKRLEKPGGKIKFTNLHTNELCVSERKPWQPILKYEINQYAPGRLRGSNKIEPVLNQLIKLGLIMTISYLPYREVYVGIPGEGYGDHRQPYKGPAAITYIHEIKKGSEIPPIGYDMSRLSWY